MEELLFAKPRSVGVLALLLACVGLYGLMSHTVFRRTGEIGLHGAGRCRGVLRMIPRESLVPVGLGILTGIAAAFSAGRIVAPMLFDCHRPALTYGAVAIVTTLIALRVGGAGRRNASINRRAEDE